MYCLSGVINKFNYFEFILSARQISDNNVTSLFDLNVNFLTRK